MEKAAGRNRGFFASRGRGKMTIFPAFIFYKKQHGHTIRRHDSGCREPMKTNALENH